MAEDDGGRPEQLAASLAQLAGLVLSEYTIDAVLALVVTLARTSVPHTDGASVSVVRTGQFETVTASSEEVRAVDQHQYRKAQGPCVEAIRDGGRVSAALKAERGRWPEFTTAALAAGFASVLSTPLRLRGRVLGALNLYSRDHDGFGEAEVELAEVFARHAMAVVANAMERTTAEKVNQQLQEALASRELIAKAQGILMVRQHVSSQAAFDVLRRASQRSNRKLREVAGDIVGTQEREAGP